MAVRRMREKRTNEKMQRLDVSKESNSVGGGGQTKHTATAITGAKKNL